MHACLAATSDHMAQSTSVILVCTATVKDVAEHTITVATISTAPTGCAINKCLTACAHGGVTTRHTGHDTTNRTKRQETARCHNI